MEKSAFDLEERGLWRNKDDKNKSQFGLDTGYCAVQQVSVNFV